MCVCVFASVSLVVCVSSCTRAHVCLCVCVCERERERESCELLPLLDMTVVLMAAVLPMVVVFVNSAGVVCAATISTTVISRSGNSSA